MKTQDLAFPMPELTEVQNLMVERLNETTLKPTSPVICINRGRKPLTETFNGNHITIPPGYFRTEYGAAMHFARRLIVPGTRTLDVGGFVSWIGILGSDDGRVKVDDEAICQPFTDEELQRFGERVEGLDRSAPGIDPAKDMRVVPTGIARSAVRGQGLRPQIDARQQATPEAEANAADVFAPPTESATRDAEAEAAVTTATEVEDQPPPQPAPMAGQRRGRR